MTQLAFTRSPMAPTLNDQRQDFLSLYPNRIQAILRPPGCKTWVSVSKHWPVPNEQIEKAISLQEASAVWGCRWGELTRFAVFDIDTGSKYHTTEELHKLLSSLAAIKLTASVYRSSESGGWHVYLFFKDWQRSDEVQKALKCWLAANRYEIRNGVLEVFPSGNGLRFPLQSGFAWLAPDGEVKILRESLTTDQAVSLFLADLHEGGSNWPQTRTLIESQLEAIECVQSVDALAHQEAISTEGFEGLWNYRLIPEKYRDGRLYWQTGLTAKGHRHDAILAVEHYLWHGDDSLGVPALPGEWNDEGRYRLVLAWLREKHNGFCTHINRGNWQKVEADIRRSVKWRRPSNSLKVVEPYPMTERAIETLMARSRATGRTWTPDDLKKGNDGREKKTRAKISAALKTLLTEGQRIGRNELARVSGCSPNSVSKHRDLWLLLASGSSDQSPFVDLDPPQGSAALSSCPEEENLLPFGSLGDSGQTELPGQPGRAGEREAQIALCCLTPCGEKLEGRRLASDGMILEAKPSPEEIEPQGSSNGLENLGYASGAIVLGGVWSDNLRHEGGAGQVGRCSAKVFVIPETYWRDGPKRTGRAVEKICDGLIEEKSAHLAPIRMTSSAAKNVNMRRISQSVRSLFILPYFVSATRSRTTTQKRQRRSKPRAPPR